MNKFSIIGFSALMAGGVLLLFASYVFEMSERFFEDIRNGIVCNRGGGCPIPDFSDAWFYAIIGFVVISVGSIIMFISKEQVDSKILALGITFVVGIVPLILGSMAYLNDLYFLDMMKKCASPPCRDPMLLWQLVYVQFFGTYGGILTSIGTALLAIRFKRHR